MAISQTIAAIGFPIIILLMIPCRVYVVPKLFSGKDLALLDAPTANAPAVMVSLGPNEAEIDTESDDKPKPAPSKHQGIA